MKKVKKQKRSHASKPKRPKAPCVKWHGKTLCGKKIVGHPHTIVARDAEPGTQICGECMAGAFKVWKDPNTNPSHYMEINHLVTNAVE